MNSSRMGLQVIVAIGFLCVGLYGQDSLGIQAPVDTTSASTEISTPSTQMTAQPDSTETKDSMLTSSSESTDSVATTDSSTTSMDETSSPVAEPETTASEPEQSTPVAEKVATEKPTVKSDSEKAKETTEENVMELEKDVVVGYGTMKKEDLTGSITAVKSEDLAKDAVYSVRKALQGKAAGVTVTQNSGQPGKAVTVRVRGVGTINEAAPLYVVDGAPVNSIDYLNPNDIESMSILKDASATAIYGSRGANGVIMVTTKKGKEGTRVINYDMFLGQSRPWREPDMCNASEWAKLVNESRSAAGLDALPELANPSSLGEGTNWFKEVTRKDALIHSENVSIAQGNNKLKSFLSAGLFTEDGIMKGSGLDKKMLRLNTESKVVDWLNLGSNIGLTRTDIDYANEQDEHNSVLIYALSMDPVTPVRDKNGNFAGSPYNNVRNPVGRDEYYDYKEKNTALNASFFSDVNLFDLLKFKTTFSIDMLFMDSTQYIGEYFISSDDQYADGLILRRTGYKNSWILENTLSYEKLTDNHALKLLLGTTAQNTEWDSILAESSGLLSNDPKMRYLNSATSTTPRVQGTAGGNSLASFFGRMEYEFANRYLLTVTDRIDGSSRFAPDKLWGNFPSVGAAWKVSNESFMEDVTFLEGIKLRVGWGKTGNQEISDYGFLTTLSGGQDYPFGNSINPGAAALSAGNKTMHWEEQVQTNAGIDITALGGRIEFNADYFIKRTDDMLVNPQIPTMAGLRNAPYVNGGSIENRGFEFVLNYREKIGELIANIGINFSTYENEVLSLGGDNAPIMDANVRNSGTVTRTEVGHPMASFYALKTDGLFQTQEEVNNYTYVDKEGNTRMIQPTCKPGDIKYRDDDRDGTLDRVFIGSPHPDFTGGFNIDLAFKGFDLGASFLGVYGNDIFNGVRWYTDNVTAIYGLSRRMLDRWTGPNSTNDANTPRMNNADANNILLSDRYVEDGSYLRLKTMQLGYSFDSELLSKIYIKKCRIYVGAENLLTITNYSGLDPEVGTSAKDQFTTNPSFSLGVDRGTYPQAKKFMVGLNLTL